MINIGRCFLLGCFLFLILIIIIYDIQVCRVPVICLWNTNTIIAFKPTTPPIYLFLWVKYDFAQSRGVKRLLRLPGAGRAGSVHSYMQGDAGGGRTGDPPDDPTS